MIAFSVGRLWFEGRVHCILCLFLYAKFKTDETSICHGSITYAVLMSVMFIFLAFTIMLLWRSCIAYLSFLNSLLCSYDMKTIKHHYKNQIKQTLFFKKQHKRQSNEIYEIMKSNIQEDSEDVLFYFLLLAKQQLDLEMHIQAAPYC